MALSTSASYETSDRVHVGKAHVVSLCLQGVRRNSKKTDREFLYQNMYLQDIRDVYPKKLPNYKAKLKNFFEEHLCTDEEIRYFLEGSGYFDARDQNEEWICIAVKEGGMIVLPAGMYHGFTLDNDNYIKETMLQLFVVVLRIDVPLLVIDNHTLLYCPTHTGNRRMKGYFQVHYTKENPMDYINLDDDTLKIRIVDGNCMMIVASCWELTRGPPSPPTCQSSAAVHTSAKETSAHSASRSPKMPPCSHRAIASRRIIDNDRSRV
ncbi:1,2-dihydroxy-3-keto-5-methylthiopentene dioxygenase 2 [Triticum urartu]|uniref:1,2-dihydroxy-3-keto-5-methylthiopentene dioxygenase 2 n=1 Tax=Triticum urartu TaxID=4572 RepID=M7ZRS4_TRIUA|nr:1,2-dihydroxy-3-keto-5-methylthiopentene dioxygenase 2 [Triticum urartu]